MAFFFPTVGTKLPYFGEHDYDFHVMVQWEVLRGIHYLV